MQNFHRPLMYEINLTLQNLLHRQMTLEIITREDRNKKHRTTFISLSLDIEK